MSGVKHDILVMKDPFDSYKIAKGDLPDLPFRILVVGKSQYAGKTNVLCNLLLRPTDSDDILGMSYYGKNFHGDNIYIISPSTTSDEKLVKLITYKQIPSENILTCYDEAQLSDIYNRIAQKYTDALADEEHPEHSLVIMDDCSFGGSLKAKINGTIAKLFCNGRHYLISSIITSQKYSSISTTCRENYTAMILFESSDKQIDLIYEDVGTGGKTAFKKMFTKITKEPHSFIVVNAKFPAGQRFQDQYFRPISELMGK